MSSLPDIRMDGVTYGVARFTGPFALRIPAMRNAYFFMMQRGAAWFRPCAGRPPLIHVPEGAVVTVPRGQAHEWSSAPSSAGVAIDTRYVLGMPCEPQCRLPCDTAIFVGMVPLTPGPPITHLTDALPLYLHIPNTEVEILKHLRSIVSLIEYELSRGDSLIDTDAAVRRLSELIAIDCARFALTRTERAAPSWLAGMTDPVIVRALTVLHADPRRVWTVASLARELGLSRSSFAERFREVIGEGPMHYLARIRIQYAAGEIRSGRGTLQAISLAFGYQSEAAFCRAFSQYMGMTPGRFRAMTSVPETGGAVAG